MAGDRRERQGRADIVVHTLPPRFIGEFLHTFGGNGGFEIREVDWIDPLPPTLLLPPGSYKRPVTPFGNRTCTWNTAGTRMRKNYESEDHDLG